MSQHVLLNNIHHQHTRVITQFSHEYGDNIASVVVYPTEFIELQKEYAILIRQHADTEKFYATALLGFQQNENLYLDPKTESGWAAQYIPATIARGPFLIGFQRQQDDPEKPSPVIHIDMQHPKVNELKGQPLFLAHGGNSAYLEYISKVLNMAHQGLTLNDSMFAVLSEFDLLESVNIEFDLATGEKRRLTGNYTINETKLRTLSPEQLQRLNNMGILALAFAVIFSMTNIRKLIDIKNRRDTNL
ncbi:MAG: SapC family protein [Paraglaciecola sp.]|nr:SapC family protein [Paraglaciecola sp.]NCT48379.1 SapC family protein [Paraglaciecola sp.]